MFTLDQKSGLSSIKYKIGNLDQKKWLIFNKIQDRKHVKRYHSKASP